MIKLSFILLFTKFKTMIWDGCLIYNTNNPLSCEICKDGYFMTNQNSINYCYICNRNPWSRYCLKCADDYTCLQC